MKNKGNYFVVHLIKRKERSFELPSNNSEFIMTFHHLYVYALIPMWYLTHSPILIKNYYCSHLIIVKVSQQEPFLMIPNYSQPLSFFIIFDSEPFEFSQHNFWDSRNSNITFRYLIVFLSFLKSRFVSLMQFQEQKWEGIFWCPTQRKNSVFSSGAPKEMTMEERREKNFE